MENYASMLWGEPFRDEKRNSRSLSRIRQALHAYGRNLAQDDNYSESCTDGDRAQSGELLQNRGTELRDIAGP